MPVEPTTEHRGQTPILPYKPTIRTNRTISFSIKNDVVSYGGFSYMGNPTFLNYNWDNNETILSGDIGTIATF